MKCQAVEKHGMMSCSVHLATQSYTLSLTTVTVDLQENRLPYGHSTECIIPSFMTVRSGAIP